MGEAQFCHIYHCLPEDIDRMDEETYMAMLRRIPHVMANSPIGVLARKL